MLPVRCNALRPSTRSGPERLEFMKFDPVARKHVTYKETKLK